jgi:transmembrane sensor
VFVFTNLNYAEAPWLKPRAELDNPVIEILNQVLGGASAYEYGQQLGGMDEFRAVGTAFAVQLSGTKVEMVVTQGKVAVDRKAALPAGSANDMPPATLAVVAAGQHVAVDLATRAMVAPIVTPLAARESDQKLSWRVPRLQLNDTPLREVVAAINAHTAARLELADAELGSLEVCGVLRVDNIDTLLTMLERNYGVRAERNDAGVAILRRVSR